MMYRGKKLAALILCAAMVIGLIPWSLNLARAEGKTITGLGTGAISNPEMKTFTVADISSLTYQGAAINVPLTVKDANSGTVLTKNTDYTVSFQIKSGSAWNDTGDVLNAGEYKAIVEGMGSYSGTSVEKAFTVGKADLTITARDQRYVYNGQPQGETDPVYEDQAVISQKVAVSGLKGGDLISSIIITGQETEIGEYNGVIEITGVGITRDGESVKDNYSITLVSGKLTITKIPQDAPAAPTVESITESSVTLKATDGYQYSKDGTNWQDSPVFTGLKSNTQYTFYQRVAEDDNHMPSPASEGTAITTGSKIYTVTKTEGTEHTIGSGENAVYKVERNVDDEEKTFANFSGAAVDGAAIPAGGSTAAPGSLILTLKSSYLDTLAPGEHKVTISFADGTAEAPLTIRAAAPTPAPRPVPQTGDRDNPVLWIGVVLLGLAGLAALAAVKASRKRK